MEQKNLYAAPKADLGLPFDRGERTVIYLRRALMVSYAFYGVFGLLFTLAALTFVFQEATLKNAMNLVNVVAVAAFSAMSFLAAWRKRASTSTYALLLFVFGFADTLVYRAVFVVSEPNGTDISNFLIFGIPAALAFWYRKLLPGANGDAGSCA